MTSRNVLTTVDKAWQDGKPIQAKTHAIHSPKAGAGKTEDKFDAWDRLVDQKRIVRVPVGEGDGKVLAFSSRSVDRAIPQFPTRGEFRKPAYSSLVPSL